MSFVASKAIAPIHQLIESTAKINYSNINSRLPLPENEDEIYRLATTINELLNRLESSFYQQKQFTSDASHEMQTPLAAIKGIIEVLLRKPRTAERYEEKCAKYYCKPIDYHNYTTNFCNWPNSNQQHW